MASRRFTVNVFPNFQVYQIVYLEYKATRLYAEVIQTIEARRMCWVRPLGLVVYPSELFYSASGFSTIEDAPTVYDLRQGADLLWPGALFRVALDTEVLPLLAQLELQEGEKVDNFNALAARQQLNQFIRQVWQAHPDAFNFHDQ